MTNHEKVHPHISYFVPIRDSMNLYVDEFWQFRRKQSVRRQKYKEKDFPVLFILS